MAAQISGVVQSLISLYEQERHVEVTDFGRSLYMDKMHGTERINIDVKRTDQLAAEDVGPNGKQYQKLGEHTDHQFDTLRFYIETPINHRIALVRAAGNSPFDMNAGMNFVDESLGAIEKADKQIKRATERFAFRAILDGQIVTNEQGTIDFHRKATHNITPTNNWGTANATILADLKSACDVVNKDGLLQPKKIIAGDNALNAMFANTDIKAQLDQRHRMDILKTHMRRSRGETYQGTLTTGSYQLDVYSYAEYVKKGSTIAKYMDEDKVIVLADDPFFEMHYGGIVMPFPDTPRGTIPRMTPILKAKQMVSVYTSTDGKDLYLCVEAKPLPVTTGVDQYAVLDVL